MFHIYQYIKQFINSGHSRTVRAKKNIIASFGIKALGLLVGFIRVPIVLMYLDVEKYGVWLTIVSIVDWINYFDLGIGHGLRNKFAIALARNDLDKAKKLVSTAYYYVAIMFSGIGLVTIPIIYYIDWQKALNVQSISNSELFYTVLLTFLFVIAKLVLNLITMILKADQKPALADVFLPIGNILSLLVIIFVSNFSSQSLIIASMAIAAPQLIVVLIANIVLFKKKYYKFKPELSSVNKVFFKEIFSLGIKFFLIQLGGLVMFASSNIILAQVVNPSEVTLFNISKQYYGLPFMLFGIILAPFWSAITDAYFRNEFDWIKKTMKWLLKMSIIFSIITMCMVLISDFAFKIWLKDQVDIPLSISISMAILNVFFIFFAPFTYFISGVGKLKLGFYVVIVKTIIFLPVAILLTRLLGATGLILSIIIVNSLPTAFFETIQFVKVINKKATGIWDK